MYLANKAGELFPGNSFAVAHCNFTLRGAESDADEVFVKEWCSARNIQLHCIRFDTRKYSSANGISLEMAARELRYAWFAKLCNEYSYDAVAVAHNANDNAETLMLNLLRGTGSRGLRGMSADSTVKAGGQKLRIIRPMLDIPRKEIECWMRENCCNWREDSTNSENDARRNILRNKVFPVFSEINPSFVRTLGRDMQHFAQTDDIAEDYYLGFGLSLEEGVDLKRLLADKHWEYLLFRVLEPCGLSKETFGKLVELLKSGRTISGKIFESPTHLIQIKKRTLTAAKRH